MKASQKRITIDLPAPMYEAIRRGNGRGSDGGVRGCAGCGVRGVGGGEPPGRKVKMAGYDGHSKSNAADAYRRRTHAIDALLEELRKKIDAHAQNAAADPADWGYAGDLGHVERALRDLVAFVWYRGTK